MLTCKIGLLFVHRGPTTLHAVIRNRDTFYEGLYFTYFTFLISRKLSTWWPKPDFVSVAMAQAGIHHPNFHITFYKVFFYLTWILFSQVC